MENLNNTSKTIYFLCILAFFYMNEHPPTISSWSDGRAGSIPCPPDVWMVFVMAIWMTIYFMVFMPCFSLSALYLWLNKEISASIQDMWCLKRDEPEISWYDIVRRSYWVDSRRVRKILAPIPQFIRYPAECGLWFSDVTFALAFGKDDESASSESQQKITNEVKK